MIIQRGLITYKTYLIIADKMPGDKNLFQKYLNPVFIETGSWHGDGIQAALDSGFKTIYSIELGMDLFINCKKRFEGISNVHLLQGDSGIILSKLLKDIVEPATFWLNGHYSGGDTVLGNLDSPLMQELNAIGDHWIKTHTLIIDDLRCWTIGSHGFDTMTIMKKILSINPSYKITFEEGHAQNDILIAKI